MTAEVRCRDEVLDLIVSLYAAAVGLSFVLMEANARPHRALLVKAYLASDVIILRVDEILTRL